MIIEIVTFDLAQGTSRADALALYQQSAGRWLRNPDLIEKYYFFDEATCQGGGVHIWPSRAAATLWHGADYQLMIAALYGVQPRVQIMDALLHVVPGTGQVVALEP